MTSLLVEAKRPSDRVAVLASGGLDSGILLARMSACYGGITPVYVSCGHSWEPAERRCLARFCRSLARRRVRDVTYLEATYQDLLQGHWSLTDDNVPDADSTDASVEIPGRNLIIGAKALLWAALSGIDIVAIGTLAANRFGDAQPRFWSTLAEATNAALGCNVTVVQPLITESKSQLVRAYQDSRLELTLSCLAPRGEIHCGMCNKCEERRSAFRDARVKDPTEYGSDVTHLRG